VAETVTVVVIEAAEDTNRVVLAVVVDTSRVVLAVDINRVAPVADLRVAAVVDINKAAADLRVAAVVGINKAAADPRVAAVVDINKAAADLRVAAVVDINKAAADLRVAAVDFSRVADPRAAADFRVAAGLVVDPWVAVDFSKAAGLVEDPDQDPVVIENFLLPKSSLPRLKISINHCFHFLTRIVTKSLLKKLIWNLEKSSSVSILSGKKCSYRNYPSPKEGSQLQWNSYRLLKVFIHLCYHCHRSAVINLLPSNSKWMNGVST
jgi:hypothetical protein